MIYTTNWHTPYTIMLSKVFNSMKAIGEWDFDQRDLPNNVELIPRTNFNCKDLTKKDLIIFNHAPSDFLMIFRCFLFSKAKLVLVVHGELDRIGGNKLKRYAKLLFYRIVGFFVLTRGSVVCIQERVRLSYRFNRAKVIEPYFVDKGYKLQQNINKRFLIVANEFSREHFNKNIPYNLLQLGLSVTLVGRDNDNFKCRFDVVQPDNELEYFSELSQGGIYLNLLDTPEAPYNLSLLDAVGLGMPIVELKRRDSIIRNPVASIDKCDSISLEAAESWLDAEQLPNTVQDNKKILSGRFSYEQFKGKWLSLENENTG